MEQCRAMCKRGECAPLVVVFDSCEGYMHLEHTPTTDDFSSSLHIEGVYVYSVM